MRGDWRSIQTARRFVEATLREEGLAVFPATLLLTDLATAVIRNGADHYRVTVDIDEHRARVELTDGPAASATEPSPVVEALARRCGGGAGSVWFEVDAEPSS